MQSMYHPKATFSDPVFENLDNREAQAMWEMLIMAGKDLRITFRDIKADDSHGTCHWEAWYTFSRTGRKVHNVIEASFVFQDGKIMRHSDVFDFWRWSRQALGLPGILMGWTPSVLRKVRETARKGLRKFMDDHDK